MVLGFSTSACFGSLRSPTFNQACIVLQKSGTSTGLLPLMVKQISQEIQKLSDENSNFTIDGVDVNNVRTVLNFY